eukprot:TRINITY_DN1222_c1_g1_i1.p1 TRINITY_DN1222_c1_g1~~TRINITY_DN1222_c1_g1_i1.p1  ORF type:complete len:312 (+),score=51.89 TRINITY_DN1222_c1_g1_i1:55-990(+)
MDYGTSSYAGSNYDGASNHGTKSKASRAGSRYTPSEAPTGRRYSIEEDATAGWITEVLASAPTKSTNATGFEEHEPSAYRVEKPKSDSACSGCSNITLIVFNIFFLLAGLGVITLSVVAMKASSWSNVCTNCENAFYGVIGLGSLIALVSIMGLVGTCASRCVLRIYSGFMVLFILLILGCLVLVILLDQGKFSGDFGGIWRSAVKSDSDAVCNMQDSFSCAGWTACCGDKVENCDQDPKLIEEECPAICDKEIYETVTKTCYTAVHDYIHDKMPLMVGSICGVLILIIVCLVASCKGGPKRRVRGYDSLS